MNGSDENEQTTTNIFSFKFSRLFCRSEIYLCGMEREREREIRSEKDRERYCVDLGYPAWR